MLYHFEWDPAKAAANATKHGVTFEQAAGVFKDPMALTLFDTEPEVLDYFADKARNKGVELSTLINELLKKDIDLIEGVK